MALDVPTTETTTESPATDSPSQAPSHSPGATESPTKHAATPPVAAVKEDVKVFFLGEGAEPYERSSYEAVNRRVERRIDHKRGDTLQAALHELVRGPTPPERSRGLVSIFSNRTAGILRSVRVDSGGRAVVDFNDFREAIPSVGTSAVASTFIISLNQTAFAISDIENVTYLLEGDCEAFWSTLESVCLEVTRENWLSGRASDDIPDQ